MTHCAYTMEFFLRNHKRFVSLFILLLVISLASGCGIKFPQKKIFSFPGQKTGGEEKLSDLVTQARNFVSLKNYPEAFWAYEKALELASRTRARQILGEIDQVLSETNSVQIRQVMVHSYEQIPGSLLCYHMGVALLQENSEQEAAYFLKKSLSSGLSDAHKLSAEELLADIGQIHFPKDIIGCLLPLSGKYALFGQQALQGIQLAVQDIAENQGVSFTIVIRDTQSDPERAVDCVDELAKESVMGIIGPLVTAQRAGERAQQLGIPMIALTQNADFLSKGDFLFSNFITPETQAQALANYIFVILGMKTAAILYPEEPYGKTFMNLFWDAAVASGGKISGVRSYNGSLTDFSQPLKKLTGESFHFPSYLSVSTLEQESREDGVAMTDEKSLGFQVLFIPDGPSRLTMILPQLTFNDINEVLLLGTNLWHNSDLLEDLSGYQGNVVISAGYFGQGTRAGVQDFSQKFQQIFQSEPGFMEAIAYDTLQIFFAASSNPRVNSREDLKDILLSGKIFQGITGETWFDNLGFPQKSLFLLTVKNKEFVEIKQ